MDVLKKLSVKYALMLCGVLVLCLIFLQLSGAKSFDNKSFVFVLYQFVAPAVVWYVGIKERKKQLGDKLTFKQGLRTGFNISVVFGLISPIIFVLYYLFVNPAMLEYVRGAYQMTGASNTMVILADVVGQFISAIIFGTLYAAIISLFLRTKSIQTA
ncbi:MAG: DUF4199 domain-containing protein [bacterium]|nr:DUF4199 domain-containing protein [bacterium]